MKDGNDNKKRYEISGVSILESLIATAPVPSKLTHALQP